MIYCTKIFLLVFVAVTFLLTNDCKGQIDDVGLWLGASVKKQVTRKFSASITQQLRLNHDVTTVDQLLSDAGLEYEISKMMKVELHYRFMNSNQDNYYSKRHRFYLDFAWKHKIKSVTFTLRERIQQQYNDYNSSELGKIPEWLIRSKLTAKFDINKKYSPYIAGELFYVLDDAKEEDHLVKSLRLETGIDYEFNRTHSINPFILFQKSLPKGFNELIYGIAYSYSI